jgi:hypothetical protein
MHGVGLRLPAAGRACVQSNGQATVPASIYVRGWDNPVNFPVDAGGSQQIWKLIHTSVRVAESTCLILLHAKYDSSLEKYMRLKCYYTIKQPYFIKKCNSIAFSTQETFKILKIHILILISNA